MWNLTAKGLGRRSLLSSVNSWGVCSAAMEWLPVVPGSTVHTMGSADHTSFPVDKRLAFDALFHWSIVSCPPSPCDL